MTIQPKRMSLVLLPRFNMMTLTTLIEPMRIANYLAPDQLYEWDFHSPEPGRVKASNGMDTECRALDKADTQSPDMIAVFGSWGAENYQHAELTSWLHRQARKGIILIGVELGVYALARAGVLFGSKITTHWSWKPGFVETFPNIEVCEQLFCMDSGIISCSGGTAGLDMMLQIICEQCGEQMAVEISNQIMHYPWRQAESPQRVASGSVSRDIHPDVRDAMRVLEANIEEPCSVPQLCRTLKVSQRSLERLFVRNTGCTIVQFSKLLRLQYARVLLTSTKMSVREVSVACGFNSLSYFSQCFGKMFGKRPSEYRQAWPDSEPAPSWPGTAYSFINTPKDEGNPSLAL